MNCNTESLNQYILVKNSEMVFWFWVQKCPICQAKNGSGRDCYGCEKLICVNCYPPVSDYCLECHIDRDMPLNPEWQERAAKLYEPGERRYQQAENIVANLK